MGIDSHFFPWRPRDEGRGEAIAGSGHSLRLPTLSRYLTTAYTFLEETTLQLATLLLALSSGHILRPTVRQRSQRTLYCKRRRPTTLLASGDWLNNKISLLFCSKAAQLAQLLKRDKNEVVKEEGPVYVALLNASIDVYDDSMRMLVRMSARTHVEKKGRR